MKGCYGSNFLPQISQISTDFGIKTNPAIACRADFYYNGTSNLCCTHSLKQFHIFSFVDEFMNQAIDHRKY